MTIDEVIQHIRHRPHMDGVARDHQRVKDTGEVFTPTVLIGELFRHIPEEQFTDTHRTFLDHSCGDGQFLGEVLIRKMQGGSTFEQALGHIYGVELMSDNVNICRDRLLCGQEQLRGVVDRQIVCANALRYHYRFDGSSPYDEPPPLFDTKADPV